jgi:hypothetical protein
MGHKTKKFGTVGMCMNSESIIRVAYLKKRGDQGNFNVNLKLMIVI